MHDLNTVVGQDRDREQCPQGLPPQKASALTNAECRVFGGCDWR
jgi:hypothetical protein